MLIIGCDFHTRYQQIAVAREETAELLVERRLDHESGEAQAFYRGLQNWHEPVRVGMEATGPIHWFERLLTELGHELLWHRHKLVCLRTMLTNQLHFLAMSQAGGAPLTRREYIVGWWRTVKSAEPSGVAYPFSVLKKGWAHGLFSRLPCLPRGTKGASKWPLLLFPQSIRMQSLPQPSQITPLLQGPSGFPQSIRMLNSYC